MHSRILVFLQNQCPVLEELILSHLEKPDRLLHIDVERLRSGCPQLRRLDLSHTEVCDLSPTVESVALTVWFKFSIITRNLIHMLFPVVSVDRIVSKSRSVLLSFMLDRSQLYKVCKTSGTLKKCLG